MSCGRPTASSFWARDNAKTKSQKKGHGMSLCLRVWALKAAHDV
jgi:hypothetical protein